MRMLSEPAVRPFQVRRSDRLTRYRRAIAVRLSPERTTWCVRVVPDADVDVDDVGAAVVDVAGAVVGAVAVSVVFVAGVGVGRASGSAACSAA